MTTHSIFRHGKRWIAVLLISVLMHWIALDWSGWRLDFLASPPSSATDQTVTVMLRAPVTQMQQREPVSARPLPRPKPKRSPRPKPVAPPEAAPDVTPEAPSVAASTTTHNLPSALAPTSTENEETPDDSPTLPPTSPAADEPAVAADDAQFPAAPPGSTNKASDASAIAPVELAGTSLLTSPSIARFDQPPPVELDYRVEALREGQNVHGHGKITWSLEGNQYLIEGEAGILFFNVLEFRSEGRIEETGIAPIIYTEKRFRKSPTNTHFQRSPRIISFSASTMTYPRQGGEQDRASIIWQLASLGRGNPNLFVPDAKFDVFVAAVRDGEVWRIRVAGEETIDSIDGSTRAWHLVREPRADSYEQRLDIWLAPEIEWYPVQLRYTDRNGDYLTLSLHELKRLSPGPK